jgi:hypothetical protein
VKVSGLRIFNEEDFTRRRRGAEYAERGNWRKSFTQRRRGAENAEGNKGGRSSYRSAKDTDGINELLFVIISVIR